MHRVVTAPTATIGAPPHPSPALPPLSTSRPRASSLQLDVSTFSPVNENGSFECDRIIKVGGLLKKGRKTNIYRPVQLVLRPFTISMYRDPDRVKLSHTISLASIFNVWHSEDPKKSRPGLFTIYTQSRNFYFDAKTDEEADSWVQKIRTEGKISERDLPNFDTLNTLEEQQRQHLAEHAIGSSDDEIEQQQQPSNAQLAPLAMRRKNSSTVRLPPTTTPGRSSMSAASFTSISSAGAANFPDSSLSLSLPATAVAADTDNPNESLKMKRTMTEAEVEQERVVRKGRLYLFTRILKVKKWKSVWAVLRNKSFVLYPNESEYPPLLVIPSDTLVDCFPRKKDEERRRFCMKVITTERSWTLRARDEGELTGWITDLKSLSTAPALSRKDSAPPVIDDPAAVRNTALS